MSQMQAWQVHELGEPRDALRWGPAEVPEPGPGQVLVRVHAAAANFPDALLCRGHYQVRPPLPFTPGVEACGTIVAVGPGVERLQSGDRVMGGAVLPHGTFAEFALLAEATTFLAPAALDDAQAAAFTLAYQTGWFALHRRVSLQPGQTLLVHAAAGGVGSAAVQLGKAAGAQVVGVAGGSHKAEVVRDLGADVVIDRTSQDFVEVVKEATQGRGADVIFDPVGGEAFDRSTKCIAFEGSLIVVGFAGGTIPAPHLNHALVKNYSIVGLHWGLYLTKAPQLVADAHQDLMRLVDEGSISPLIGQRGSMADVPAGVQAVADGSTVGRVVFSA
ncbi:MAG: NADPH:quinone oxidoreductase family protein [Actinomycetales bacterium]|nr:NADPH:quinone oxidoreductase family protein [Actinomycetales bacterium]